MLSKFLISWTLIISTISINSLPTYASAVNMSNASYEQSDASLVEVVKTIINSFSTLQENCEVRVYDSEFNLIRFGAENCESIQKLIPRTDFITEINGIKFFILNHKNSNIGHPGIINFLVEPVL